MSPRLSDLILSSQSDERLVSLARAGHDRAFVAIVERYRPELNSLARRLCSDGRSEDIVQQAFLSAFAALRSGAEVKHLRGWLYRIVRNAATRSRMPLSVPLDGTTPSAETLEDVVQHRALAMSALSELARLPERQRQAIVGTALDGLARSEVARSMGISEGAVRQLVHRARASLRTVVTAVTPCPLVRWFVAAGPVDSGSAELGVGAGAATSGGVPVKLGALLASGTLLTGVAAVGIHGTKSQTHRAGARAAAAGRAHSGVRTAPVLALAPVAPSALPAGGLPALSRDVAMVSPGPRATGAGGVGTRPGGRGARSERGDSRRGGNSVGSGRGDSGRTDGTDRSNGGSSNAVGADGNGSPGGENGNRGSSLPSSGSGSGGRGDGGGSGAAGTDGGGGGHDSGTGSGSSPGSGSGSGSGSGDGGGSDGGGVPQPLTAVASVADSGSGGGGSDGSNTSGN